jgi:hypothetical protein
VTLGTHLFGLLSVSQASLEPAVVVVVSGGSSPPVFFSVT